MEEFEYDVFEYGVPDYIKKLERPMILGLSTPINKMDNNVTGVRISHSNSNLGSFITYKNENKVGHIDRRNKINLLSEYLYAHMINGFELDYNKIANHTFIHKPERIGDTLLCVLNKRTLYVLAIYNQILFAINLDNDYVHLETVLLNLNFRIAMRYSKSIIMLINIFQYFIRPSVRWPMM